MNRCFAVFRERFEALRGLIRITRGMVLCGLVVVPASAQPFTYVTNSGTITITGYTGTNGIVSIPTSINGLSVTAIGGLAFGNCTNLSSVTVPSTVSSIGDKAFWNCTNLGSVHFMGNAPSASPSAFEGDRSLVAYFLPGSTGWPATFSGIPTALWTLPYPVILNSRPSFGVQTNQFGFIVSWATNLNAIVESSSDLSNPIWSPLATNTLAGGWFYFADREWTNYPTRFYRITALAPSNIYSLNIVGQVNVAIHGGGAFGPWALTMIANPLDTMKNTIGSLIPRAPDGTVLYKFNAEKFEIATYLAAAGWDHPEYTLNPGEGAIVNAATNWTITFVGEVLQGVLTNSYPAGFSIRASQVPQAGTLTILGLGPQLSFGDVVYRLNPTTHSYENDNWLGYWPPPEPSLSLGESFWLQTSAPGNWSRTFTVH